MNLPYLAAWVLDCEFRHPDGYPLPEHVRCMVAKDIMSGRELRIWGSDLPAAPPFDVDRDLFIAFAADAEWSCFLKLGWRLPANVIDLRYEYLGIRNAMLRGKLERAASLNDALRYFGLPAIVAKKELRGLAMRPGPNESYTDQERADLIAYCTEDVYGPEQLLPLMALGFRLDEAVWRGRFSCAIAVVESNGIPLDAEFARWLSVYRSRIRRRAITELDQWGVYRCQKATIEERRRERGQKVKRQHECSEACELTSETEALVDWMESLGLELERYRRTGNPILSRPVLEEYKNMYEEMAPAISLRHALSDLQSNKLVVGPDGRNRAWLAPFGAITSRCQPSNSEYIFGLSRLYRNLIQAPFGRAVINLDFSQQEFLIAAVRSQDDAMFAAYMDGDTYIGIGKAWGLITPEMTAQEVAAARKLIKSAVLGIQFQMGAGKLAKYIKRPRWQAAQFILLHKDGFWKYWKWSDDFVNSAQLNGDAISGVNWDLIGHREREPTLRNFPIQSAGGEILRQTCSQTIAHTKQIMIEATRLVLNDGNMLRAGDLVGDVRVDAEVYAHPVHFNGGRDGAVWNLITRMREEDGYAPIQ